MAKRQSEWPLPDGWVWASVGELAEAIQYGHTASANAEPIGPKFLRITDIQDGRVDWAAVPYCECSEEKIDKYRVKPGDIVFARTGATTGKSYLIGSSPDAVFASYLIRLRISRPIETKYFASFFASPFYWSQIMTVKKGSAQPGVNATVLSTLRIPLPPLLEQRRIVAVIETQFTRLDAGVAALERARANLRRYRAAVLKAACEGRLVPTEAELARAEGREYESADQLLDRILAERRAKWEAEHPGKKYREPAPPDTEDLPELPEGWVVASMDQLTSLITSGPRHWSKYYDRGDGVFLMAQNVRPGELDLSYRQWVDPPVDDSSRERSQVRKGDLLVTIVGANTGDVCRVPRELPEHYICQSTALMRPVDIELSEFVTLYMFSPENGQRQYRRYIYGAGRPHLKFEEMRMTAVLLPSLAEQRRIVAEVERRLSVVEALEREVEAALARAGRLRQAVLKRAFEGRLVAQDPDDEPAAALLERIRATREARAAGGKKRETRQMRLPEM